MVRTCPRCFATIVDDTASVCPGCRSPLPAEKPIEPSEMMKSLTGIQREIKSCRAREVGALLLAIVCIVAGMLVIELFSRSMLEWCVGVLLGVIGGALILVSIRWEHKRNHLKKVLERKMTSGHRERELK